eukprot:Sspe_Gene.16362::Locus_5764_Transcript_1_1_Confidence_1.000_Length_3640::g.16362::m.16362
MEDGHNHLLHLLLSALLLSLVRPSTPAVTSHATDLSNKIKEEIFRNGVLDLQGLANQDAWQEKQHDAEAVLDQLQANLREWFKKGREKLGDLRRAVEEDVLHGPYDTWYWDSEGPHTRMPGGLVSHAPPPGNLTKFPARYKWFVDMAHSAVRVPANARRDEPGIADFIKWSARLDTRRADLNDKAILYYNIGDSTGTLRFFPGRDWPRNLAGVATDYDARTRQWYVAANSGPKDVVFIVDTSSSMAEDNRIDTARAVVGDILGSLSEEDYFSVVLTGQMAKNHLGQWVFKENVTTVGCDAGMSPGTPSKKHYVSSILNDVVPKGGTRYGPAVDKAFALLAAQRKQRGGTGSCSQAVVFVTDDSPTDGDARCGEGRYLEDGNWQEPDVCNYEEVHADMVRGDIYQELSTALTRGMVLNGEVPVFTYTIAPPATLRASEVVCDQTPGKAVEVPSLPSNIRTYTKAFHEWSSSIEHPSGVIPISPYIDAVGSGRTLAALSLPFRIGDHRGVVSVDMLVDDIKQVAEEKLWGDAYFFLLNGKGEAIIHPRLVTDWDEVETSPVFPPIEELEMIPNVQGTMDPVDFYKVRDAMLHGEKGNITIQGKTFVKRGSGEYGYHVITENKKYTFGPVSGTNFTVCIVLRSALDTTSYYTTEPPALFPQDTKTYGDLVGKPVGLFHRLDLYDEKTLENYKVDRAQIQNYTLEGRHGVYFPPTCFCNVEDYREKEKLDSEDVRRIDQQLNDPNYDVKDCSGRKISYPVDVKPECIYDARQWLSNTLRWSEKLSDKATVARSIQKRYFATRLNILITFPATINPRYQAPKEMPWYHRGVSEPRNYAVSGVHTDALKDQNVVTLSKAVMQGPRPNRCSVNTDCNGLAGDERSVCYKEPGTNEGTCTRKTAAGVVSIDFGIDAWKDLLTKATTASVDVSKSRGCGEKYNCTHSGLGVVECEVRCYLVDSGGLVVWNSSVGWPEANRSHATFLDGELMRQLTHEKNVFERLDVPEYGGKCSVVNSWRTQHEKAKQEALDFDGTAYADALSQGTFIPRHGTEACLQIVSFHKRLPTFPPSVSGILRGCVYGNYSVAEVPDTDLILIEIEDFHDRVASRWTSTTNSPLPVQRDFHCVVSSRAMRSSLVRVHNLTCSNHTQPTVFPSTPCFPSTRPNIQKCTIQRSFAPSSAPSPLLLLILL